MYVHSDDHKVDGDGDSDSDNGEDEEDKDEGYGYCFGEGLKPKALRYISAWYKDAALTVSAYNPESK
jgi:hypothetical protein